MIRLLLFLAGGAAGVWLAYTFWFNVFERTAWNLFWNALNDVGGGKTPSLESIVNSRLFLKTAVSFLSAGVLTVCFFSLGKK